MEWPGERPPTRLVNMQEPGSLKKQLSLIYLLISLLYLAAIFNFSLYLQLQNQIGGRSAVDLSSQQVANQRLVDQRSIDEFSPHHSGGLSPDELDSFSVNKQNKNEVDVKKPRERFKRSHQFNLDDFDLSRVWSSEDESLKQRLINNYRPYDDENRSPVRRAKKVRSVNEDKLEALSERPTLHPPPPAGPQQTSRSARHRLHQKRRLIATTSTTESSADQDEQSAEFFSQPQPNTGHANGKVWVNSYSRVPVSHVRNGFNLGQMLFWLPLLPLTF